MPRFAGYIHQSFNALVCDKINVLGTHEKKRSLGLPDACTRRVADQRKGRWDPEGWRAMCLLDLGDLALAVGWQVPGKARHALQNPEYPANS